jgi:hypothetical protein
MLIGKHIAQKEFYLFNGVRSAHIEQQQCLFHDIPVVFEMLYFSIESVKS